MTVDEIFIDELQALLPAGQMADAGDLRCALNGLYDKLPLRSEELIIELLKKAADEGIPQKLSSFGKSTARTELNAMGAALAARTGRDPAACRRAVLLWAAALGKASLSSLSATPPPPGVVAPGLTPAQPMLTRKKLFSVAAILLFWGPQRNSWVS